MVVLTVYTDKYDSGENVYGNGMSGKVFLEKSDPSSESGREFKGIDEALSFCVMNDIKPERIDFNYMGDDGFQRFWKFNTQKQW